MNIISIHTELLRQQSWSTFDIDLDHNISQGQGYTSYFYLLLQWNLSNPTHQGTREMCRMSQDVGKLGYQIVQVPLYLTSINKDFLH
jgi:hypothetical protein